MFGLTTIISNKIARIDAAAQEQRAKMQVLRHRAEAAEAARDAALAEVAAMRRALEEIEDTTAVFATTCRDRARAALTTPPSAALADLRARVRDAALEEAAKVAQKRADLPAENDYEQGWRRAGEVIAAAIRAMKGQGDG